MLAIWVTNSIQNEKLALFGVTHVIAIDGYTSKVVSHAAMPVKNNLVIYEAVYRYAIGSIHIC